MRGGGQGAGAVACRFPHGVSALASTSVPPAPEALFHAMYALIGGLLLFALLLLLGTRIVRWLKLPQDLPEGPRFEPPAPPTVAKGDRAAAALAAAAQSRLRAVYDQAHAVVLDAVRCQDLHQQVVSAGSGEPFAAVAPVTERCAATAVATVTAVEQALTAFDQRVRGDRSAITADEIAALRRDLEAHAATVNDALIRAKAAVAPLPDGGNRRLVLLVVMLVVMIAWVVAMQMMLKK